MSLVLWHTGTKAKTLEFLKEAKRQSPDVSDLMSEVEDEDEVSDWMVAVLECRICGQRQTAVMPIGGILENAECPNCGNMTSDAIDND